MKALIMALAAALLVACGGGGSREAPTAPVATSPSRPPQSAPSAPPGASAPHPSQAASAPDTRPPTSWVEQWREPWSDLVLGGWVRHSLLACAGGTADPDRPPEGSFVAGHDWVPFGAPIGTLQAHDGALHIDSPQTTGGYALLSGRTWPTDRPLAVQATVTLRPDPGAWLGLTLIADETDYRELALYEVGGRISAGVWHPCKVDWGVAADLQDGPRTLRLEYTPGADVCWRHYVDGVLVASERCSVPGAPLTSAARVGIYIVNLRSEGQRVPGLVRATVGEVVVESGR